MKTAISIPDDVFERAERTAARLGWSRSQLYTRAVAAFLVADGSDDPVTGALDRLVDQTDTGQGANPGRALINAGQWEW